MGWPLSLPALLILGWAMAGLLWWDRRRRVILDIVLPWAMAGMILVALAMAILLATIPAPPGEQIVRGVLLLEGVYGFWVLSRRATRKPGHGPR